MCSDVVSEGHINCAYREDMEIILLICQETCKKYDIIRTKLTSYEEKK